MNHVPVILDSNIHTIADLNEFLTANHIWEKRDEYKLQLEELFYILNPSAKINPNQDKLLSDFVSSHVNTNKSFSGNYVYYPWNGNLIHILDEEKYFLVRTNRNRNIINEEDQKKLYNTNIAIAGLSIGGGMAINLVHSGMAKNMKLADFDTLSLSNLNRVQESVIDLGRTKSDILAHRIYAINPYVNLKFYDKGLNSSNLSDFIGDPKPQLIFEEIDDFEMKIRLRLEAKKARVPVIMLTNLGDRLLIDVERYDLDKDLPIFNGLLGNLDKEILSNPVTEEDKKKYAIQLVGKENLPNNVYESVLEINKTLVGRPQIMSTVSIGAGMASYLTRRLFLGKLDSGRKLIDISNFI